LPCFWKGEAHCCSWGKEDRHPNEGYRRLIVHKDLKSLVEQLGPGRTTLGVNSCSLFWFP
jgi:hypothetical protein